MCRLGDLRRLWGHRQSDKTLSNSIKPSSPLTKLTLLSQCPLGLPAPCLQEGPVKELVRLRSVLAGLLLLLLLKYTL